MQFCNIVTVPQRQNNTVAKTMDGRPLQQLNATESTEAGLIN